VPDPDRFTAAPGQRLVVLRRRVPGLAGLVRAALVVPEGNADLAEVVRRLLELAKREMPDLPADELLTGILERERSMSTAMGLGVIIPHTYHQSIPRTQCLVANVCCGLRSDAPGGELIHLVFLVLSPMGEAEAHLHALAAIARLVSDSDYRRLLGRQKDGDRLLELVRERE
jgi:PTS system nitrogen regulatory IIA component